MEFVILIVNGYTIYVLLDTHRKLVRDGVSRRYLRDIWYTVADVDQNSGFHMIAARREE